MHIGILHFFMVIAEHRIANKFFSGFNLTRFNLRAIFFDKLIHSLWQDFIIKPFHTLAANFKLGIL